MSAYAFLLIPTALVAYASHPAPLLPLRSRRLTCHRSLSPPCPQALADKGWLNRECSEEVGEVLHNALAGQDLKTLSAHDYWALAQQLGVTMDQVRGAFVCLGGGRVVGGGEERGRGWGWGRIFQ